MRYSKDFESKVECHRAAVVRGGQLLRHLDLHRDDNVLGAGELVGETEDRVNRSQRKLLKPRLNFNPFL